MAGMVGGADYWPATGSSVSTALPSTTATYRPRPKPHPMQGCGTYAGRCDMNDGHLQHLASRCLQRATSGPRPRRNSAKVRSPRLSWANTGFFPMEEGVRLSSSELPEGSGTLGPLNGLRRAEGGGDRGSGGGCRALRPWAAIRWRRRLGAPGPAGVGAWRWNGPIRRGCPPGWGCLGQRRGGRW